MPTNSQILIDGFISDEFSKQAEYSSKKGTTLNCWPLLDTWLHTTLTTMR